MRWRAEIREMSQAVQEISNLIELKSRATREEFEEISRAWADTRGRRFESLHLQPQAEMMDASKALLEDSVRSTLSAEQGAVNAERSLRQAYDCQREFEGEKQTAVNLLRNADDLTARTQASADGVEHRSQAMLAAISSAAHDPGW